MTDSTAIGSSETRHTQQRRVSDKAHAANKRSSFNPLHPSMELPPEQLIRLLGLESKKIRKPKRAHARPVRKETTATAVTSPPPEPVRTEPTVTETAAPPVRPTHRQREYEQAKGQSPSKQRRTLLIPALTVGLVCGVAVSAYLFWLEPDSNIGNQPAPSMVNKVNRNLDHKPQQKVPPVIGKKMQPSPVTKDPAWQATLSAQAKRLQTEAKLRFDQRLKQTPQTIIKPTSAAQADVIEAISATPVSTSPPTAAIEPLESAPLESAPLESAPLELAPQELAPLEADVANVPVIETIEKDIKQQAPAPAESVSKPDDDADAIPATSVEMSPPTTEATAKAPIAPPEENVSELF